MPTNTLYLTTSPAEWASPAGRWIPNALEELHEDCGPCFLALHPRFNALEPKTIRVQGIPYRYVGQMHVSILSDGARQNLSVFMLLWHSMASMFAMIATGLSLRPERIVICKPHPVNTLAGLLIAILLSKPVDLDCDDYEAESNHVGSGLKGALVKWVLQIFERTAPKFARRVTVNSFFLQRLLVAWGVSEAKITVVPNRVIDGPTRHWLESIRPIVRARLQVSNSYLITYIGTMSTVAHAVDLLLLAFAKIHDEAPLARLLLVGDGPERQELQALGQTLGISSRLVWLGAVPRSQRWDYFAAADLTVDPVRDQLGAYGRSPLKIYESIAAERIVITSQIGDRTHLDSNWVNFCEPTVDGLAASLLSHYKQHVILSDAKPM